MICTILSVTSSGKRRNKEEIVDVVMWVEGGGDGRWKVHQGNFL